MDKDVLPVFPYRDDGLLVYEAIKTYISKIIKYYYGKILRLILSISSIVYSYIDGCRLTVMHPKELNFVHRLFFFPIEDMQSSVVYICGLKL